MNAAELMTDLTRLGIRLEAHGDRLRYRPRSAVTPDLAERMKTHKAELLAILRPAGAPDAANATPAAKEPELAESQPEAAGDLVRREDCIDPPEPCPTCGGLVFWWNPWGDRRCCMVCDPPTTAIRLLQRAERIRRRHRIPSPAGASEMLAEPK